MPASEAPKETPVVTPSAAPLTITLFGPLSVLVQGQPIPHLRSRKAQWVLCLLTLRHNRSVQREWLAGVLWPEVDQTQAFANLRPALSELRKALGSEGTRLQSPSRHSLLLDLTGAEVDVLRFDKAIASRTHAGLEQAVALYQGSLLEGCTEEWAAQDREARHQECLRALQELATASAQTGKHEAAADYWRRAVGLDPLWEVALRGLMEALIGSGDSNEALAVYRIFVRQLRKDDPKAAPDAETSALYTRLLASLRKRADHATTARTADAPSVAPVVTGYLPHALTRLIGREDERLEVAALLQHSRLVTLFGVGGIGKTRLAIEVASEVVGEYKDGVWLVALDSLTDGKLVAAQIAGVFRVKETPGKTLLESVVEFLRKKRVLLVLDNCEHVLLASLEAVGHLLKECVGVRILATSREALGITGEAVWPVPCLSMPEPDHLPQGKAALREVLLGYDSVKLFVERARAVENTFALTGENAPWVARLCANLEGIPLGIELAAGRIRTLTVEQIARNLENHFNHAGSLGHLRLLTRGSRNAGHRQQTLRGALDWSFNLLSDGEQALLPRLSVFAGGWTLEAAEAVCAGEGIDKEGVLDMLTSLADKSLVVFGQAGSEGRFRLLEMVRQYSVERLAQSGMMEPVRRRHRNWYLAFAEQAKPQCTGPNQQLWLNRLETEHDNLRTALEWCREENEHDSADAGLRLTAALSGFWEIRGYFAEARRHLERALTQNGGQSPTVHRAGALVALGVIRRFQSDYAASQALCEEALGIYQNLGDLPGIANINNQMGSIARSQGNHSSAKTLYETSLSRFRALNDRRGVAMTLNNLGNIAWHRGDTNAATAMYEESLHIRRELGDTRGIAYALRSLGSLANNRGDFAAAHTLHEESLRLRRELGDQAGMAESLINLGNNALYRADYVSALELFEESVTMYRKLGERYGAAIGLGNQAQANYMLQNYASAFALFTESLALRQEIADKYGVAVSLLGLCMIAQAQGNDVQTEALLRESLSLFKELEDKEGIAEGLRVYGTLHLKKHEAAKATRLFGAADALHKSTGIILQQEDRLHFERQIGAARAAAGDDVFSSEWEAGLALKWMEAVAYALGETFPTLR